MSKDIAEYYHKIDKKKKEIEELNKKVIKKIYDKYKEVIHLWLFDNHTITIDVLLVGGDKIRFNKSINAIYINYTKDSEDKSDLARDIIKSITGLVINKVYIQRK